MGTRFTNNYPGLFLLPIYRGVYGVTDNRILLIVSTQTTQAPNIQPRTIASETRCHNYNDLRLFGLGYYKYWIDIKISWCFPCLFSFALSCQVCQICLYSLLLKSPCECGIEPPDSIETDFQESLNIEKRTIRMNIKKIVSIC